MGPVLEEVPLILVKVLAERVELHNLLVTGGNHIWHQVPVEGKVDTMDSADPLLMVIIMAAAVAAVVVPTMVAAVVLAELAVKVELW